MDEKLMALAEHTLGAITPTPIIPGWFIILVAEVIIPG
jgi:hypothetical protein